MRTFLFLIFCLNFLNFSFAQISYDLDTWEPIGNTQLQLRYDDADNGDGLNDGALQVDGIDTIGPLGVLYTFQGVMQMDERFHLETTSYKYGGSYVKYFVELYNKTDEIVLVSTPLITHGTFDTPEDVVETILDYTAKTSDVGDVLQLRYVRENTTASNHVARNFAIDHFSLNGEPIAAFEQVFAPKPFLDIEAKVPDAMELSAMSQIYQDLYNLMLGDVPPTEAEIMAAVSEYEEQEIVVSDDNISGLQRGSKSDWAQAGYLKTFAQHLKFFPTDVTVYSNGLTIEEMAVNTIWLFAEQYYRGEIPFDFINYSYKLYAAPAVHLTHLLNDRQYGLFYYSLYYHSRKMVYYWSPEYITGIANTGSINEDDIYNISDIQLAFGLIQDGPVEQLQWTKCFKRYYERFMSYSPGTTDGIKPDGSSFHHYSALNNYTYCYNTPSKILPILQGTPFQVSQEAYLILRKAVYGQLMVANDNVEPLGMAGRHAQARQIAPRPDDIRALALVGGEILGLSGADPILAGAYIRHWGTHPDLNVTDPEQLSGFIQMNHHTGGIFWKDDWMISTRGQTNWGFGAEMAINPSFGESRSNRNIYGRYQSYGTLEVLYPGGQVDGNGFVVDEWNWNFNPGATTIVLPWDLLKVENSVSQRELQRNGFTGSLAFDRIEHDAIHDTYGKYGIFAMDFLESTENNGFSAGDGNNHDTTFTFKKSVFFFDDYILSLGSNISNETESHPTVTTLFQRSSAIQSGVQTDQGIHEDFGSTTFSDNDDHWLIDPFHTGYYVLSGNDALFLNRELQQVPQYDQYDHELAATNDPADNTIAYLHHGNRPDQTGYEFLVFPNTTANEMEDFAQLMSDQTTQPYTIIQKDQQAHIVQDFNQNITGFAIFEPLSETDSELLVQSSNTPCLIMHHEVEPTQVRLALSNPDLGLHYRSFDSSAVIPIQIVLRGAWDFDMSHPNVSLVDRSDSTTTFQFNSIDGLPIEILLSRIITSISSVDNDFRFFPNPANHTIYIDSKKPIASVKVIDIMGKASEIPVMNDQVYIGHLETGVYLLQIETGGITVQEKFVKL